MKITVYLATSINGMVSNASNVPNWLSQEYDEGFHAICRRTNAVIMGKRTYEILSPDYLPLKEGGTLVVMTHDTAATPSQANVVLTDGAPNEIGALLEARGHEEAVIIGGTQAVSAFMRAGLVDELDLVVEPVLFGAGLPLLRDVDVEWDMTLLDVQRLGEQSVRLRYRLIHPTGART